MSPHTNRPASHMFMSSPSLMATVMATVAVTVVATAVDTVAAAAGVVVIE